MELRPSVLQCVKNNHRSRIGRNTLKFSLQTGTLAAKKKKKKTSSDETIKMNSLIVALCIAA